MATINVDSLRYVFRANMAAQKYDEWDYYESSLRLRDWKAVDIVAMRMRQAPAEVWLIECKDFRIIHNPPLPANLENLPRTIFEKARDTLRGLEEARYKGSSDERLHSNRAMSASKRRIVLHLEPHVGIHSALFPRKFEASVLQKLKQLVRDIDPSPLVLRIENTKAAGVPWSAS